MFIVSEVCPAMKGMHIRRPGDDGDAKALINQPSRASVAPDPPHRCNGRSYNLKHASKQATIRKVRLISLKSRSRCAVVIQHRWATRVGFGSPPATATTTQHWKRGEVMVKQQISIFFPERSPPEKRSTWIQI
jgi:hypothetical protein